MSMSGFPYAEVEFDRTGAFAGDQGRAVRELASDVAFTDLLVLSHGWNNDSLTARLLYEAIAASMRQVIGGVPGQAGRRIAVAGVLWPSRKFARFELGAGSPSGAGAVLSRLDDLRELFPHRKDTVDAAAGLVPALPDRVTARTAFVAALLSLFTQGAADREDASAQLFTLPGATLMHRLAKPASEPGGRGAAALLGGAASLLDYLSYYEMKARAGVIGEQGLGPLLTKLARPGLRIHLAGHSFGGRLVTAAAKQAPAGSIATLTLLQAALSHFGFAEDWNDGEAGKQTGAFNGVLAGHTVSGPILITHTANDLAVGIAYAIASRIAGQVASLPGDASSLYGGIGRNGAQRTAGTVTAELLPVGGTYDWHAGVPHNLRADRFVHSHTDVHGPEIAHAILSAIAVG
jgi:hypothetical protein